jgi:oxygen-independent coproporphyrinogen-3 oxidase
VDLMFAVPGQTLADFAADLDRIVEISPDHVSLYGLTLEPGTPFARVAARKPASPRLAEAADDLWRAMYDLALERLESAGIHRYEVSNFAREGHRCLHNEHYWRARSWAGLGASAHGFRPDLTRTTSRADVDGYIEDPASIGETVPPHLLAVEIIGSTLRHVDGLDLALLEHLTGCTVNLEDPAVAPLLRHGTIDRRATSLRIRKKDLPVTDYVATRLCGALLLSEGTL